MRYLIWAGNDKPELNAAQAEWCREAMGESGFVEPYVTLGVTDGSALMAVLVYNGFDPDRAIIEISGASVHPSWLTLPVLNEVFAYPFDQLGCQMAIMRVSERNRTWNGRGLPRLLRRIGFRSHHVPRLRGREEGEIIWTLTDDDWKSSDFRRRQDVIGQAKSTVAA